MSIVLKEIRIIRIILCYADHDIKKIILIILISFNYYYLNFFLKFIDVFWDKEPPTTWDHPSAI